MPPFIRKKPSKLQVKIKTFDSNIEFEIDVIIDVHQIHYWLMELLFLFSPGTLASTCLIWCVERWVFGKYGTLDCSLKIRKVTSLG